MSLRNKIIRLAHEKPELRKHLLPLITKGAGEYFILTAWLLNDLGQRLHRRVGAIDLRFKQSKGDLLYFTCNVMLYDQRHPYVKGLRNENMSKFYMNYYMANLDTIEKEITKACKEISSAKKLGYDIEFVDFKMRNKRADDKGYIKSPAQIVLRKISNV